MKSRSLTHYFYHFGRCSRSFLFLTRASTGINFFCIIRQLFPTLSLRKIFALNLNRKLTILELATIRQSLMNYARNGNIGHLRNIFPAYHTNLINSLINVVLLSLLFVASMLQTLIEGGECSAAIPLIQQRGQPDEKNDFKE